MKKRDLLLILMAMYVSAINAIEPGDYDFKVGSLYYFIVSEKSSTCEVVQAPQYKSEDYESDLEIPSSVTYDNVEYSVIGIGQKAFYGESAIISVKLPSSLQYIGASAFNSCENLKSIVIPESVSSIGNSAFKSCVNLKGIVIPESVSSIGNSAFKSCVNLKGIVIPESVSSIGSGCFSGCQTLQSVVLPSSLKELNGSVFAGCQSLSTIELPNGLEKIGGSAFNGSGLTTVKLPESVAVIGQNTFSKCTSLSEVVLPNSLKEIPNYTFNDCVALKSIDLPKSLESIGQYAFNYCSGLSSIELPENLYSIGLGAFAYCTALTQLYIPSSVQEIENNVADFAAISAYEIAPDNPSYCAVDGIIYTKDMKTLIMCPPAKEGNVDIPEGTTEIYRFAFENCYKIKSVTIPNTVTSFGNPIYGRNFFNCCSLESVSLSSGLTEIAEYAFGYCSSLKEVNIPEGITRIGLYAFCNSGIESVTLPMSLKSVGYGSLWRCPHLKEVVCRAKTPPALIDSTISNIENCTLRIFKEYEKDYKKHEYWGQFWRIRYIDESGIANPEMDDPAEDGASYTIQGLKANSNYKGITIRNGKKYLQK